MTAKSKTPKDAAKEAGTGFWQKLGEQWKKVNQPWVWGAEPMELRSVQELLEQVTGSVLPGVATRFVHYDEPRYRSALRLHIGAEISPAAVGGVLAGSQGRPPGVEAAHLRFFLEPWATLHSGQAVDFARYP